MAYQWQGVGPSATSGVTGGRVPNSQLGFTEPEDERFKFSFGSLLAPVGRGIGRVWSELDRPLTERAGFRLPEMAGPVDEIGNFLLNEASRPTNLLFALPGVGASNYAGRMALHGARKAGASSGLRAIPKIGSKLPPVFEGLGAGTYRGVGRLGRSAIEPIAGYGSNLPLRLAAETGVTASAAAASRAVDEFLPENVGGWGRVGLTLGLGLAGGIGGAAATTRLLKASGHKPDVDAILTMDNMISAAKHTRTPQGRQAWFSALQADNLLKKQFANRAIALNERKDALLKLSGLLDESGSTPTRAVGPERPQENSQLDWMEMLIDRNNKRLQKQGHASGMSMDQKMRYLQGAADAEPLPDFEWQLTPEGSGRARVPLDRSGGSRARRWEAGEQVDKLEFQNELQLKAREAKEAYNQFHDEKWWKSVDQLSADEQAVMSSEMNSVLTAKDAMSTTGTIVNYLENKDLRGGKQFFGDVDGLDELINFGLGEDENMLRLLAFDDELYDSALFHGVSGKTIASTQAANPLMKILHASSIINFNPWGAATSARDYSMRQQGRIWANSHIAMMSARAGDAQLGELFDITNKPDVIATGRLTDKNALKLVTDKDGNTGFDLSQKAVEEGRLTQEQKDFFTEVIRGAALRMQMLKRAGIDPEKLRHEGGMHVRGGKRVSQIEYNQARDEIINKKEGPILGGMADEIEGTAELGPLATEIEAMGIRDLETSPVATINTKNPLIGDVLELGVYDDELEDLLRETGGAYFHRELYSDPKEFKRRNKVRARRGPNTDITTGRQGVVEGWEYDTKLPATMEEMMLLVPDLNYEGNFMRAYQTELEAFVDLLADQQLIENTALRGKTEVQVVREVAPVLLTKRKEVKASIARLRVERSDAEADIRASSTSEAAHRAQQKELHEELKVLTKKFYQLNSKDTPSSRGYETRGVPVEFEGDTVYVPQRIGDDLDAPVYPDADGQYPTRFDEQGQPELERRGQYDVQSRTFRAQMKLDALNLNGVARDTMRQIQETMNLIDALNASFLPTRQEYRHVARRLGGLKSALMKARDGVKAKKEFTTTRGRRVEVGESLQRNISDLDDQILDILGEGWEIRQVDANALGLGRSPEGQMRRVYDRPTYGQSSAFAFHLNGQPISMERVLENLESHSYDKNGNSRLGNRFTSKQQIEEKRQQYNELFKSYVTQTEKVNGILNSIEEVENVYNWLVEQVALNATETNELNAAISGVIANYSTEAGTQMSFMLNNFDRAIIEARLKLAHNQYDRFGTMAQVASATSARKAARVKEIETKITGLETENQNIDLRYQKELDQAVSGNLLNQVDGLSGALNGKKFFSEAAAAELQMQLVPEQMNDRLVGQLWKATNAFNNTMRPVMAAFDMSALGIQGLLAMGANPTIAAQAMRIATQSVLGDPKQYNQFILDNYSRATKGDASIQTAVARGLHWSAEDAIGEFGMDIGRSTDNALLNNKVSKALGISKLAVMSNVHFSRTGNLLRYMMYQQAMEAGNYNKNLQVLMRGQAAPSLNGMSEKDQREMIEVINEATGWSKGKPNDLQSTLLFAPRFFRSQLNILSKSVKGKTEANKYAGDLIVRTLALGSFFTIAMNEMRGETTDFNPIKTSIDGDTYYNTNFMKIKNVSFGTSKGGGADLSVFGPWDTLAGMITMAFSEGPFGLTKRTLEYKASPMSGLVTDIFRGRTFGGEEVFRSMNPVTIMTDVWQEGSGFLPFTAQDVIEPLPYLGSDGTPYTVTPIFNFFGVKGNPTSATERRDKAVADWIGSLDTEDRTELGLEQDAEYVQYRDLTGKARVAFNAELPEHEENMRQNRGRFAVADDKPALAYLAKGDIRADRMDTIERLIEHYDSGGHPQITMSKLLDLVSEENRKAAIRRADVDELYETAITNPDLSDPNDMAMHQFYSLYSDPEVEVAPNVMDWQAYDRLYSNLYSSWTPEQRKWVNSRQPAQYPEALQPYMDAKTYISRSGYYSVGQEIFDKNIPRVETIFSRNNLPTPRTWTGFDALWTDMKRTNPQLAAQLAPFHRQLGGQIDALKDNFMRQDPQLSEALILTGRRTNPEYSMLAGTR